MKAVINSTPLIALGITNHLEILSILFDQIFVPNSVYNDNNKPINNKINYDTSNL